MSDIVKEYKENKKSILNEIEKLKEIFPDNLTTKYNTLILTGSIGLGKSFISYLTTIKETDNELLYRLKMLFVDLYKTTFQSIDTFYFLDCYQPQTGDPNEFLLQISYSGGRNRPFLFPTVRYRCR